MTHNGDTDGSSTDEQTANSSQSRGKRLVAALLGLLVVSSLLYAGVFHLGGYTCFLDPVKYDGAGTIENPYQVETLDQLQAIDTCDSSLDASYELVNDIDATPTQEWNDGNGFEPIGNYDYPQDQGEDTQFTGRFDGNNHTIDGLYIERFVTQDASQRDVGLFGASNGRIANVSLTNTNVSGFSNVGGLVGRNNGIVAGSSLTGDVSGRYDVGGLVGQNEDIVRSSGTAVDVSGYRKAGGLVGQNSEGTIETTYSTGAVSGNGSVGGLVGRNSNGRVTQSYAAVNVSGGGGLVGSVGYFDAERDKSVVQESYYDASKTPYEPDPENVRASYQSTDTRYGFGLTTSEMQGITATDQMRGFDFSNTWDIESGEYPKLR